MESRKTSWHARQIVQFSPGKVLVYWIHSSRVVPLGTCSSRSCSTVDENDDGVGVNLTSKEILLKDVYDNRWNRCLLHSVVRKTVLLLPPDVWHLCSSHGIFLGKSGS